MLTENYKLEYDCAYKIYVRIKYVCSYEEKLKMMKIDQK